jgi:hypothetical protein
MQPPTGERAPDGFILSVAIESLKRKVFFRLQAGPAHEGPKHHRQRASGVTGSLATLAVLFATAVLWIAFGMVKAVRDVLAERAVDWLLPPNQPITFDSRSSLPTSPPH